jgi:hypothetical protein
MDTTCLANGQRQITTLNYEISTMWEALGLTQSNRNEYQEYFLGVKVVSA